MSTPEDKLIAAASSVKEDLAKVAAFWSDYRLYLTMAACLIVGAIVGHKI